MENVILLIEKVTTNDGLSIEQYYGVSRTGFDPHLDFEHIGAPVALIGVDDRAAKGGFVEALRMLIEDYGADYLDVVRRNGETLAHSAAMNGHIEVLKYLKSKGMNLHTKSWESVDFNGAVCGAKRAVDWAKYYYQSECVAFLEADAKYEFR